ncbi:hypothetical protein H0X09_00540 [Candidatus Saccharibacteria bacterium]|nr:hypothetical protein [Candidatus Saccharibacteria bacterium]
MPPNSHQTTAPSAHQSAHQPPRRRKHIDWAGRTIRLELFIVIVGSALLLAATSLYLGLNGGLNTEAKRIDSSKFQAVFLNGGATSGSVSYSTYFGKINAINDKYIVLNQVYFLTDQKGENNQSTPQLTKLGCQQLHSPLDEMVINRSQVAFWENLRGDGKVVEAIKAFEKQNPKGPNCDQQTPSTQETTPQPTTTQPTTPPATPNTRR